MKFNAHPCGIVDITTWKQHRPPKEPDIQWRDGRSAKELARYMTAAYPTLPAELEAALQRFAPTDACWNWDAEMVTPLPGVGEGRNHDAFLKGDGIVVGIEAKADETLGRLIKEELAGASVNKLRRIAALLGMVFKGGFKEYGELRYQLLTAMAGTLLEAEERDAKTAVLLVLVFQSAEHTTAEKVAANSRDIEAFLAATEAVEDGEYHRIPNNKGIDLYFKKIDIAL